LCTSVQLDAVTGTSVDSPDAAGAQAHDARELAPGLALLAKAGDVRLPCGVLALPCAHATARRARAGWVPWAAPRLFALAVWTYRWTDAPRFRNLEHHK